MSPLNKSLKKVLALAVLALGITNAAQAEIIFEGNSDRMVYDMLDQRRDGVTRAQETTITGKLVSAIYYRDLLRCGRITNRVYPPVSYFCEIRGTHSGEIQGEIKDGHYWGSNQQFTFAGGSAQRIFDLINAIGEKDSTYRNWNGVSGTTSKPTVFNSTDLFQCHRSQGKFFTNQFGWYCSMPMVNVYDTNMPRTTSDDDDDE